MLSERLKNKINSNLWSFKLSTLYTVFFIAIKTQDRRLKSQIHLYILDDPRKKVLNQLFNLEHFLIRYIYSNKKKNF